MINWALFLSFLLSVIIMIGLPIVLAFVVTRVFKVSWLVVLVGVGTYIVSQVVHIPALAGVNALFNNGTLPIPSSQWIPLMNGLITGFLAAICEEPARWVGFKLLGKKAEKFGSSLALGVGHGGAESIIVSILGTVTTLVTVLFYNAGHQIASGVATSQVQSMLAQIASFWEQPFYIGLLPGLERIITISAQILLSILVWKSISNRNFWWFVLAIAYHMIFDATAVFLGQLGMATYLIEGVLFIFLLLNAYLIYTFITNETAAEEEGDEDEGEEGDEDDGEEDEDDEDDDDEDDEDTDDEEGEEGPEDGDESEPSERDSES